MRTLRLSTFPLLLWLAGVVAGCSQGNSGDQTAAGVAGVPVGIERFLTFPNPVVEPDDSFETTAAAYAQAYYTAVDPGNQKTTLIDWKSKNNFGSGTEHTVVFRDVRDLGYGRRMNGHYDSDRIAFFVENYQVSVPGGGYTAINVDAAVARDSKWHIGTNAIEWSCHPDDFVANPTTCVKYAKYYNFAPNGQRQLTIDMDGRGQKAMPGPCITCHGGRGDPLDPGGLFPRVENTLSALAVPTTTRRGDVQGRLHIFQVDSFEWSTMARFTRPDQEASLKDFNLWVLCSYPVPTGSPPRTEANGCVRNPAGGNEWQGTSAVALLEAAYGGTGANGLPNAAFSDTFLPSGWSGANAAIYQQVVAPYCRTCHMVRGTLNQSDADFDSKTKFDSYADRIKVHVFDRGNMPLALLVYQAFWLSSAPGTLASYIDGLNVPGVKATNSSGTPLQPGRPIADLGPAVRMAQQGTAAPLSGKDSLFASSYNWSITDPPGAAAAISNPNSQLASFQASASGLYTVQLTVTGGSQSDSKITKILVPDITDLSFSFPDPSKVKFAQVVDILRNHPYGSNTSCTASCHTAGAVAPILYDEPDLTLLLARVSGRVNLTEVAASPLLRKPAGQLVLGQKFNHHKGGIVIDLAAITDPSPLTNLNLKAALGSFSKVYYWILNGMPAGGVAASARDARTTPSAPVVFGGGPPATATIPVDAGNSINATTYAWSIVTQPNAGSFPASFSNAAIVNPNLIVRFPGAYVLRLDVTDGAGSTDTTTLSLSVSEASVSATASPSGPIGVTFTGSGPATGTVNLSSAGTTGNPLTYAWSIVSGPAGASFDNAAAANPVLTVPEGAIGGTYVIQLIASNVSTSDPTTTSIMISAVGSTPSAVYSAASTARCTISSGGTTTPSASCTWSLAPPDATITLNGGGSSGPGTLTYLWQVLSGPAGSSIDTPTSSSATLHVVTTGTYRVQLFVGNSPLSSGTTVFKDITVSANATFAQVKAVFTNPTYSCASAGCHAIGNPPPCRAVNGGLPPSWEDFTDSCVPGKTLYQRVVERATTNDGTIYNNLLLLNPLGSSAPPNNGPPPAAAGHGGGMVFSGTSDPAYITFLTWIIGGTPP